MPLLLVKIYISIYGSWVHNSLLGPVLPIFSHLHHQSSHFSASEHNPNIRQNNWHQPTPSHLPLHKIRGSSTHTPKILVRQTHTHSPGFQLDALYAAQIKTSQNLIPNVFPKLSFSCISYLSVGNIIHSSQWLLTYIFLYCMSLIQLHSCEFLSITKCTKFCSAPTLFLHWFIHLINIYWMYNLCQYGCMCWDTSGHKAKEWCTFVVLTFYKGETAVSN